MRLNEVLLVLAVCAILVTPAAAFASGTRPAIDAARDVPRLGASRAVARQGNQQQSAAATIRVAAAEARRRGNAIGSRAIKAQERIRAMRRAEHDPRGEVIGSLLTAEQKAALFEWLPPWLRGLRSRMIGFTAKKEIILRWRVAQQRSLVDKAAREIEALQKRVDVMTDADRGWASIQARIATLRRDAGMAESRILGYKRRLGASKGALRPGLLGEAARAAEVMSATEERAARVLWSQLRRQADPWELLREDTFALLRLGSNLTLASGYARLSASPRLMPHAAAIVARAAKLERFAPGILIAIDGYLDLVEPHLDEILERLDAIEPVLPFALANLDLIAPHCGVLLEHFDVLMLYADEGGRYLDELSKCIKAKGQEAYDKRRKLDPTNSGDSPSAINGNVEHASEDIVHERIKGKDQLASFKRGSNFEAPNAEGQGSKIRKKEMQSIFNVIEAGKTR